MNPIPYIFRTLMLSLFIIGLSTSLMQAQRISDPSHIERSRLLIEQKLSEALE